MTGEAWRAGEGRGHHRPGGRAGHGRAAAIGAVAGVAEFAVDRRAALHHRLLIRREDVQAATAKPETAASGPQQLVADLLHAAGLVQTLCRTHHRLRVGHLQHVQ